MYVCIYKRLPKKSRKFTNIFSDKPRYDNYIVMPINYLQYKNYCYLTNISIPINILPLSDGNHTFEYPAPVSGTKGRT